LKQSEVVARLHYSSNKYVSTGQTFFADDISGCCDVFKLIKLVGFAVQGFIVVVLLVSVVLNIRFLLYSSTELQPTLPDDAG